MLHKIGHLTKRLVSVLSGLLGTVLGLGSGWMFFWGFVGNMLNVAVLVGFLFSWVVFSAVTDELDSVKKKVLASLLIPAFIVGFTMVLLWLIRNAPRLRVY